MIPGVAATEEQKEALLERVADFGGNLTAACKGGPFHRCTVHKWARTDLAFKARLEDAREQGVGVLEDEARRRAFEGNLKPVFYKGEARGAIREYSDLLLIFLLKGALPGKYRERHEISLPPKAAEMVREIQQSSNIDQLRRMAAETQGRINELLAKDAAAKDARLQAAPEGGE